MLVHAGNAPIKPNIGDRNAFLFFVLISTMGFRNMIFSFVINVFLCPR